MNRFNQSRSIVWLAVVFFMAAPAVYAKVIIQPDFDGTLLITTPDGKVSMMDKGDALPEIPSGSTVEVFGGHFAINTEEGDKVTTICGGNEGKLDGIAAAVITCGEASGSMKAVKGVITLTDTKGTQTQIAEGSEQTIKESTDEAASGAPETGGGDELGTPADPGTPPVDSRGIESSLIAAVGIPERKLTLAHVFDRKLPYGKVVPKYVPFHER